MKATFDVTIKIDNRNVETSFGMKEGAQDVDANLTGLVLKIITNAQKELKEQFDRYYGVTTDAPSQELLQQLYDGKLTHLEYVQRSAEYQEPFKQFCQDHQLQESNHAAQQFLDSLLKEEESAHTDGLD